MKRIHFIVNPIAGSGKHNITSTFLSDFFDKTLYDITVKYSEYKKHAKQLTLNSITEKADIIVACGGDGTINEIASCLVNSSVVLGIIPIGSGNGLASHLKIPKKIFKAIDCIKRENIVKVDVGKINNIYFFSNTGIGFDAHVVRHYENSKTRKLSSYVKATFKSLREFHRKTEQNVFVINEETRLDHPFMIFISNSNELGYNVSLTPKASLQDGLIDIIIVPNISFAKALVFGFLILFKKHHLLKVVNSYQAKSIVIHQENNQLFQTQIDGEMCLLEDSKISISILEKSLNVIV